MFATTMGSNKGLYVSWNRWPGIVTGGGIFTPVLFQEVIQTTSHSEIVQKINFEVTL